MLGKAKASRNSHKGVGETSEQSQKEAETRRPAVFSHDERMRGMRICERKTQSQDHVGGDKDPVRQQPQGRGNPSSSEYMGSPGVGAGTRRRNIQEGMVRQRK